MAQDICTSFHTKLRLCLMSATEHSPKRLPAKPDTTCEHKHGLSDATPIQNRATRTQPVSLGAHSSYPFIELHLLQKVRSGIMANGSCRLCNTFSHALIRSVARVSPPMKIVTASAGPSAIIRVRRTLCHFGILSCRNPSMTNCPAYVPVIVLL